MDAATVLGACGIAYVMRFMRAMMQGAFKLVSTPKLRYILSHKY